ncbi:MAG: F0F1 ATP synthase subunit epsilon [Dehalococcoidales bacterium]
MSSIKLDIVTAERVVFSGDVNEVVAPGIEGQLGILPHHAPLMTILQAGELVAKREGQDEIMAISGGFLEVRPDRVIILADAAERAEEIDMARAEAAKKRAEERLRDRKAIGLDEAAAEAALKRAITRLSVAEKIQQRRKM